nr:GAF domain-containing protein [uncultured Desulfobacter sp.]
MNINSHLLGDHLISLGIITEAQLGEVLALQARIDGQPEVGPESNPAEFITKTREKENASSMLGQLLLEKNYITRDILDPVLAMQNRQVRELRMLSSEKLALVIQIGFLINSTQSLVGVLSLIMKYANIVTDTQASTLMLLDESTGELVFSVPTGPRADNLKDIRIPKEKGVAGWVLENQQYVLLEDVKNDPRFYPGIDALTGLETRSLLCVPIRSKRKKIGVLEVINKNWGRKFTDDDALLLSLFSQQAAIAIENALLFDRLKNNR